MKYFKSVTYYSYCNMPVSCLNTTRIITIINVTTKPMPEEAFPTPQCGSVYTGDSL